MKKFIILIKDPCYSNYNNSYFLWRNIARLEKENRIYSYNILQNINYPLNKMSFRYQLRMKNEISENKTQNLYKNRFIFFNK